MCLKGCHDGILHLQHCAESYLYPTLGIKLEKVNISMGACSPIMLPVTVGLGGSMAVASKALASVPATGGGGALLRSRPVDSLDAISIVDGCRYRALVDSHDLVSGFEAMVDTMPGDPVFMSERRA